MANVEPAADRRGFDGSGTFEFGEPRRFEITNRSTGRSGRNLVPMTGTVHAIIVGDDYRFDHNHRLPGFDFEGRMSGRINRKTALLSTMTGPAHARVSDVADAVAQPRDAGLPGTGDCRRGARRPRPADDAGWLVQAA